MPSTLRAVTQTSSWKLTGSFPPTPSSGPTCLLSVVCGEPPKQHIEDTPALVVEVLLPGTRERDLTFKKQLYADLSVPWYLILDPETNTLQVLQLPDSDYQQVTPADTLELSICDKCLLNVQIDRLFR